MIEICEVGPRDGLQNEKTPLSIESRVEMIQKLADTGLKKIEAVSFVNPKVVPQMAHAEEVMKKVPRRSGLRYAGLVLSPKGMERAFTCDLDDIHLVLAASDSFNQKNARRTTKEGLTQLGPLVEEAKRYGYKVNCIIGTAFGCPYEGEISPDRIFRLCETFLEKGADSITLADTTGMAHPQQVTEYAEQFQRIFPKEKLGLHFHNTRGLGLANVYAGYQAGVRSFDASIGGLGGCPFAPLAVGNVCTEDLVHMFQQMNQSTEIDLNLLIKAAKWTEKQVRHRLDGLVMKAGLQRK